MREYQVAFELYRKRKKMVWLARLHSVFQIQNFQKIEISRLLKTIGQMRRQCRGSYKEGFGSLHRDM